MPVHGALRSAPLAVVDHVGPREAHRPADESSPDREDGVAAGRVHRLEGVHEIAAAPPVQDAHVVIALAVESGEYLPLGNLAGPGFRPVDDAGGEDAGDQDQYPELPYTPGRPGLRMWLERRIGHGDSNGPYGGKPCQDTQISAVDAQSQLMTIAVMY